MKKLWFLILFIPISALAQNSDVAAARGLAKRILPAWSSRIEFAHIPSESGSDVFEIESSGGKLRVSGNNANSMAVGLNYYLTHYCHTDVSWYRNNGIHLPARMPLVSQMVRKEARCKDRFFLNYCTYGYTMPWWQWSDWQWFIDWMALNGVNMPLAITGQEAIWYKVWRKFGLTDQEIRAYFTGPAYLPWHRMSNIDHWDGPLPMSWLNNQLALQKKIVARERALGMKPVLPAFSGHVPELIKEKFPKAKITSLGEWSGFSKQYDSYFLDPFDSLFKPIQKMFLDEQEKAFGSDHIYGTDPFNEVTPPSWEPSYLADVAKTIYSSIQEVDSSANWLQMGWIFYDQRDQWTNERIKAYLTAVPKGRLTMLDYFCDKTEVWKFTDSFYGQPYIWCYLGNFGGNTMMNGDVWEVEKRMENVFENGGKNLVGIGSTLEGFGVNPMMYQYVFDKAWNPGPVNVKDWVSNWAYSRYGQVNDSVSKAWDILSHTVYSGAAGLGRATLTNARPDLTGHNSWTTNPAINYKNSDLLEAWKLLVQPKGKVPLVYQYDVVDVGRQVLGNYFSVLRDKFTTCYHNKDAAGMKEYGRKMLGLLDDLDTLLGTNADFLLGKWIDEARAMGTTPKEKDYYEQDARKILTVWGEPGRHLTDYANRNLAGLTRTYYRGRWKLFVDQVEKDMAHGVQFDHTAFLNQLTDFEDHWTRGREKYRSTPVGDCMTLSRMLIKKYEKQIQEAR
ncbi:MAG: alpha-N-acetylglucosaminidase [Bacteroidota bacterium]|nr:alpha-N-acetylglucosaminidase [Bacteroidota bacterium]